MDPAHSTGCAAGVNNRDLGWGFFVCFFFCVCVSMEASSRIGDCL